MEHKAQHTERSEPTGKRTYSPPDIVTQEVFETTALACGKRVGQGGAKCGPNPRNS
jgi:hypothetical protein